MHGLLTVTGAYQHVSNQIPNMLTVWSFSRYSSSFLSVSSDQNETSTQLCKGKNFKASISFTKKGAESWTFKEQLKAFHFYKIAR